MKNVFITGASQGLGKALAAYFSERGWFVYAGCFSGNAPLPGPGKVLRGDIADEKEVRRMFAEIDTLDVLITMRDSVRHREIPPLASRSGGTVIFQFR